jgi:hypothetical protein
MPYKKFSLEIPQAPHAGVFLISNKKISTHEYKVFMEVQ